MPEARSRLASLHRTSVAVVLPLYLVLSATALAAADSPRAAGLELEERAALVELYSTTHAQTLDLIAGLSDRQWRKKPSPEAWSVGEIVEHLVLAEGVIRSRVDALLAAGPVEGWKKLERVPLASLVELGADRSRKFEAPEPIQPQGDLTRKVAMERLMAARAESIRFVLETDAALRTVAAPAPIGTTLDGYGWLGLLGAHNLRHNRQLEETLAALGWR